MFTPHDKARAGELINLLKQTAQPVPDSLMAFGTTVKKKEHSVYGAFFKDVDTSIKATKVTFDSDDE
jgi:ATP-dependent RNA helicase DBP3